MQTITGLVISNKTAETIAVQFDSFQKHPKYKKIIKKTTKILAHNELEGIKEGDIVRLVKSKPYSKRKHFKVVEKLEK